MQHGVEMGGIGLVEAVRLADMGIDHARIFIVEQPLVEALERKLARVLMERGNAMKRVGEILLDDADSA